MTTLIMQKPSPSLRTYFLFRIFAKKDRSPKAVAIIRIIPIQTHPTISPIAEGESPVKSTDCLFGESVGAWVGFLSVGRGAATETLFGTP